MLIRIHPFQFLRALSALGVSVVLSACGSVTIVTPANNATSQNPVAFDVKIGADRPSHTITLTNTATNQSQDLVNGPNKLPVTYSSTGPDEYKGAITLAAGNYRIDASGVNANKTLSATSTFTVAGATQTPTLSFSPAGPITLNVGATTTVTITRSSAASGAATVTLSASPTGRVMLPANPAFTATGTTTQFTINGQAAGTTSISASAPAHTAPSPLTVNVQTSPPSALLLFRSHASGVEVYRFTPGANAGTFQRVSSTSSSMSPGLLVVGLDRKNTTLIRSGSQGFEAYTIGGTLAAPTLTLSGSAPSTGQGSPALTSSGTDAAISSQVFVRAIGFGIETWQPGTLSRLGSGNTGGGATAGQALLADPNNARILRSTPSSLEIWDVSTPSTPTRLANNISVFTSQTVPGIDWLDPGHRLVRSHTNGIQIIAVDETASPPTMTITGSNAQGGGTFGAVAVAGNATMVARAIGQGLEIYSIPPTGNPTSCGISNQGNASAAGVAVTSSGNLVFRATPTSIEAYDLSALSCPTTNVSTALTLPVSIFTTGVSTAQTGLGLAGPN